MPQNPSVVVDSSAMWLNVTWMPPGNLEQFDLENYTVVLFSNSDLIVTQNVSNTILQVFVQQTEGVTFTVEITATDMCGKTSDAASFQLVVPSKLHVIYLLDLSNEHSI